MRIVLENWLPPASLEDPSTAAEALAVVEYARRRSGIVFATGKRSATVELTLPFFSLGEPPGRLADNLFTLLTQAGVLSMHDDNHLLAVYDRGPVACTIVRVFDVGGFVKLPGPNEVISNFFSEDLR